MAHHRGRRQRILLDSPSSVTTAQRVPLRHRHRRDASRGSPARAATAAGSSRAVGRSASHALCLPTTRTKHIHHVKCVCAGGRETANKRPHCGIKIQLTYALLY
eukprot:scaffold205432_cov24-Tisochrysis_lutea.AAC.1